MIEPTKPVNPYENNPYEKTVYGGIPELPPPPPKRKRLWPWVVTTVVSILCVCVLSGVLFIGHAQQNTGAPVASKATPTSRATPKIATPTPRQQTTSGELSKTPLVEQDGQGNYVCYVITTDEPNSFVVLSNPTSNVVFGDCMTLIGQNAGYYSSTPKAIASGDVLQCQGWGTDMTSWK